MSKQLSFTPIICTNNSYGACYYKTLENSSIPDSSYKNILTINLFTLVGLFIYNHPKLDSTIRTFLNYFISVCFYSESFIWGGGVDGMPNRYSSLSKNGILLCYYDKLLEWQRGWRFARPTDKYILKNTNTIPIFTSCVADCIIAMSLRSLGNISMTKKVNTTNSLIQYLGQEQQNYESTKLFTTSWTYPIDYGPTKNSNPDVFKNNNSSVTHKFILGPSTWLAMSSDIIIWLNKEKNQTENTTFKNEIRDGTTLWEYTKKYTYIYEQNLINSYKKLKTKTTDLSLNLFSHTFGAFGEFERKIMDCFNWDKIANIENPSNVSFDVLYNQDAISKLIEDINNNSIIETSNLQTILTNIDNTEISEKELGETIYTIINDISKTKKVTSTSIQAIQQFYCGRYCICPFMDPTITCVSDNILR